MSRTVLTFGTFDVFHVGHLRVIERAAQYGDRLVVGVSSDALNMSKKGREPVFSQGERLAIVAALKAVDEVFVEESLELKRHYIEQFAADVLVMGDDWAGKFDEFEDICEVVYLPRTPGHLDHRADREDLRPRLIVSPQISTPPLDDARCARRLRCRHRARPNRGRARSTRGTAKLA